MILPVLVSDGGGNVPCLVYGLVDVVDILSTPSVVCVSSYMSQPTNPHPTYSVLMLSDVCVTTYTRWFFKPQMWCGCSTGVDILIQNEGCVRVRC